VSRYSYQHQEKKIASLASGRSRCSGCFRRNVLNSDTDRHGTVHLDAVRHGICLADGAWQGIFVLDARCQGIFLLDAAVSGHFASGRSRVRAFCFWTQPCQGIFLLDAAVSGHFPSGRTHVRAFSFWTQPCQGIILLAQPGQGKWHPDDACYGTVVTLAVKARNIAANTRVTFTNTQRVPGIVTQSSSILYI